MIRACLRATCFIILVGGFTGAIGCTPITPLPPPPAVPAAISTFQTVSGKWAGILRALPQTQKDDWVTLVISGDGTYQFMSPRTIGIFQGQGPLALIDGKLRTETDKGLALLTLYEERGRRMLKVEGATNDGVKYSANLDPSE
jgi:hypothetical protein